MVAKGLTRNRIKKLQGKKKKLRAALTKLKLNNGPKNDMDRIKSQISRIDDKVRGRI
jgi:hypothetical protein